MKTLWDKGTTIDDRIAQFTVGDDREVDAYFAEQDVLGSIAHVLTLHKAKLLTSSDAYCLGNELIKLKQEAEQGLLAPTSIDEDIHSTLERILTENLGEIGKRVHTARSRNDQVATDVALWIRTQALGLVQLALQGVEVLSHFAEQEKDTLLVGMTHLQPAMPSSIGAWALGYASLLLDDIQQVFNAYRQAASCPLGSAAGYGVPKDLAPLDREYTSSLLGFDRPLEPVTSVQGGRGKVEASLLFATVQLSTTCTRFARDLTLYVNPQFGFFQLPVKFTTGSSIMPQKRNPDVLELIRGVFPMIQSSLMEVLTISASVPSGYHRDFQRLKAPLLRGVEWTRQVLEMLVHIVPELKVDKEALDRACPKEIDATRRALELVVQGMPFRDAYKQVAEEVFSSSLPDITGPRLPELDLAFKQVKERMQSDKEVFEAEVARQNTTIQSMVSAVQELAPSPSHS